MDEEQKFNITARIQITIRDMRAYHATHISVLRSGYTL